MYHNQIAAYFLDVSSKFNYYFEYHTDCQDSDLKGENDTFNDRFTGEYETHIKT